MAASGNNKNGFVQKLLSPFVEVVPEGGEVVEPGGSAGPITSPAPAGDPDLYGAVMEGVRHRVGASCVLQLMDALESLRNDVPDEMQSLKAAFRVLKLDKGGVEQEIDRVTQEVESEEAAALAKLSEKEREEVTRRQARHGEVEQELAELEERLAGLRQEREALVRDIAREQQAVAELRQGIASAFGQVHGAVEGLLFKVRRYAPQG